jgi:hypothetical protein
VVGSSHSLARRGGAKGAGGGGSTPPNISLKTMPKRLQNFFSFCDYNFQYLGTCNTPLERCFQDLSNGILQVPKFQKFQLVKPNKIWSRLMTTEQAGKKNCNGKTPMFIGEDWMVNLMIIYIKKVIAKALDFNDIIKNIMGMSAQ